MNKTEFSAWLAYHVDAFPTLGAWLVDNANTADHWERALEDVSLEHAKAATDAMLSGEMQKPMGWTSHPSAVRDWARRVAFGENATRTSAAPQFDGEETYYCHHCQDRGIVSIYTASTMRAVQARLDDGQRPTEASMEPGTVRTGAVACFCEQGGRFRNLDNFNGNNHSKTPFLTYQERCMIRVDEGWDELVEHVATSEPKKPDNYVAAFDSFNGGDQ